MKNKELCFRVEGVDLYLEYVLVEYIGIPIFFLCKGENEYYVVLCINLDELNYYIIKPSLLDIFNLLHSKITMRDMFLKQPNYWFIESGDNIESDVVTNNPIKLINVSDLPVEGEYFEILDKRSEMYVQSFDQQYLSQNSFLESDKHVELNELLMDSSLDALMKNISQSIELSHSVSRHKISRIKNTNKIFYKDTTVTYSSDLILSELKQIDQIKNENCFNLSKQLTNNIVAA